MLQNFQNLWLRDKVFVKSHNNISCSKFIAFVLKYIFGANFPYTPNIINDFI